MNNTFDYVIIGGGISGLIAAHELSKTSQSICLIEPAELGGCIRSSETKGFILEHGATTLVLTPSIKTLLTELELIDNVSEPAIKPFQQYVWHNGAPHKVPKSPPALFKSKLFTLSEKFKIIKGMFTRLPLELRSKQLTLAELFGFILGPQAVSKALNPALRGIYGGDVSKLIASYVFSKITHHLLNGGTIFEYMRAATKNSRTIFHLKGGNSLLIERLKKHLTSVVVIKDQAISLTKSDKFVIKTESKGEITARSVLIATSGKNTASFIASLAPETAQLLNNIRYAPITVVHVSVPLTEIPLKDAFGLLFPSHCDARIIGALFNSQLFPHTAPDDKHLITICIGGINDSFSASLSKEAAGALAISELDRLLGIRHGEVLSVFSWERAIPQYEAGIGDVHRSFDEIETENPGLCFIGVDRGGVGVPDRIEHAIMKVNALIGSQTLPHHGERQAPLHDTPSPRQARVR